MTARCARALVLGLSCWACWACGGPPKVVDQPVLDKKPEPPPAPIEWPALAGSVQEG